MRYFIAFFLCTVFPLAGFTQEFIVEEQDTSKMISVDSLENEIGLIPEALDANVDSLIQTWHMQYVMKKDEYCHDDETNFEIPDSVYADRIRRMPCVIPMAYNDKVRDCIELYVVRRRDLVKYILGMANLYFPIIEQVLDKHQLPLELKCLAIVESALNPVALSRVGAGGLWQFMLPTGKIYGLEINSLIDERCDPEKATEAACRYFKDMYAIYKDWNLVLASYNCGPGNVNKAIRRSGGKTDFWDIFRFLPKETRSYVPLFIAANYVMNYYCDHNLCPREGNLPLATDTVMVSKMLHLQQVSDVLNIDMAQLRALNPQYRRDIIPGNTERSILRLPAVDTYSFVDKEDTIYAHRAEELLADCAPYDRGDSEELSTQRIYHKVESGETIYKIANRYGVTASQIRKWNGLRSSRVSKGMRLRLNVDNGGVAFASNDKTSRSDAVDKSSKANAGKSKTYSGRVKTYTVRSGDSLYTIAKKYPGVSAEDLQNINGLNDADIYPGQELKIPLT